MVGKLPVNSSILSLRFGLEIVHDLINILLIQNCSDLASIADELSDSIDMSEVLLDHFVNLCLYSRGELISEYFELLDQEWLSLHEIFGQLLSFNFLEVLFIILSDPGSIQVRHILQSSFDFFFSFIVNEFLHFFRQVFSEFPRHTVQGPFIHELAYVVL